MLSGKKLFRMEVRTRNGIYLGKVYDISFDTQSQSVLQYHVRIFQYLGKLLPFLFKKRTLFISRSQVVGWTEKEMCVEDTCAKSYTAHEPLAIPVQKVSQPITSCSSTDRAAPS